MSVLDISNGTTIFYRIYQLVLLYLDTAILQYQTLGVHSLEASLWYFDLNCFKQGLGQYYIASTLLEEPSLSSLVFCNLLVFLNSHIVCSDTILVSSNISLFSEQFAVSSRKPLGG
jgi:hypothetical protein